MWNRREKVMNAWNPNILQAVMVDSSGLSNVYRCTCWILQSVLKMDGCAPEMWTCRSVE